VNIAGREFLLSAATQELRDEQDAKWKSRTILVRNVSEDMEETVVMYLENQRKGGGDIEATKTDRYSGTLMVTYHDKEGTNECVRYKIALEIVLTIAF